MILPAFLKKRRMSGLGYRGLEADEWLSPVCLMFGRAVETVKYGLREFVVHGPNQCDVFEM
jgi:hypothetical protein